MTDQPIDPNAVNPEPIKYNVLLLTAAVVSCEAMNEMDAAQRALLEGPSVLDPRQLQWVVKYVSDKPIHLGDPDDEMPEEALPQDTPEPAPKLEIIR